MMDVKKVIDRDGLAGIIEPESGLSDDTFLARFENGQVIAIPKHLLSLEGDVYQLPFSATQLAAHSESTDVIPFTAQMARETLVIPIVVEALEVGTRDTITGTVRLKKTVHEEVVSVDQPLMQEQVQVERVAINRFLHEAAGVHTDGDTIVIPVVEEVLVVEKRLLLREEVRVTKKRLTAHHPQEYTVRRETVEVERVVNPQNGTSQGQGLESK